MLQIHEKIRQARESAGLTEEQIAHKIGIPRSTYQNWEKKTPNIDKIKRVASVLNLSNDYFFDENTVIDESGSRDYLESRRNKKNEIVEFRVPLVTVKARAGYVTSYDNMDLLNSLDKYAIPPGVDHVGAIWRYFEVDGDSMDPTLNSGDHVLCSQVPRDDWENIRNF